MRKVILQFQSIMELIDFQQLTNTFSCQMDPDKFILSCSLTDAEIELAQNGYQALVLQELTA